MGHIPTALTLSRGGDVPSARTFLSILSLDRRAVLAASVARLR